MYILSIFILLKSIRVIAYPETVSTRKENMKDRFEKKTSMNDDRFWGIPVRFSNQPRRRRFSAKARVSNGMWPWPKGVTPVIRRHHREETPFFSFRHSRLKSDLDWARRGLCRRSPGRVPIGAAPPCAFTRA